MVSIQVYRNWQLYTGGVISFTLEKTGEISQDTLNMTVNRNNPFDVGDSIILYMELLSWNGTKGLYPMFYGVVRKTKLENAQELIADGFLNSLQTYFIAKKYVKGVDYTYLEDIVRDIITTQIPEQKFTYKSSGNPSGIAIDEYSAIGQAMDIIRDIQKVLGWKIRSEFTVNSIANKDIIKTIIFENNADYKFKEFIFSVGDLLKLAEWDTEGGAIVNHVIVTGSSVEIYQRDDFTGDGVTTVYTLTFKFKTIEGYSIDYKWNKTTSTWDTATGTTNFVDPTAYKSLKMEEKKIEFNVAPPNGMNFQIYYIGYRLAHAIVEDDISIQKYGRKSRVISNSAIKTDTDAYEYGLRYLETNKVSKRTGKVKTLRWWKGLTDGIQIAIRDIFYKDGTTTGITEMWMVIKKAKWIYPEGILEMELENAELEQFRWRQDVETRLKELQNRNLLIDVFRRAFNFGGEKAKAEDLGTTITQI